MANLIPHCKDRSSGATRPFEAGDVLVDDAGNSIVDAAASGGVTESIVNGPGAGVNITRSVPANTLSVDGESLTFEIWGTCTSGDSLTISFGSTTIFSALSITLNDSIYIKGTVLRTGSSAQLVAATLVAGTTTTDVFSAFGTDGMNTALSITGSDTSNGITYHALITRKWSA